MVLCLGFLLTMAPFLGSGRGAMGTARYGQGECEAYPELG